jgi:hypothetical protein
MYLLHNICINASITHAALDRCRTVLMQAKSRRPAFLGFCNLRSICCLIIFAIVAAAVIATAQKSEAPKSEHGNMQ